MPSPLDIAGIGGSILGPIISGIAGQNSQQWLHGLLASIFQLGGDANTRGVNTYQGIQNDILPQLLAAMQSTGNQAFGPNGQLAQTGDFINGTNASIPGLYSGTGDWKTGNADAVTGLQQLLGQTGSRNLAGQVFAGGGWTPQGQQGFDQISKLLGSNLTGSENGTAIMNQLFSNQGSNDTSTAYTGAGRQALSNGGFTPTLSAAGAPLQSILGQGGDFANNDILRAFGLDALGSGGYTANSGAGSGAALDQFLSGGQTATTQGLQNRGLELANREPLLPTELVTSMARDEAGRNSIDAFKKAASRAAQRGGGPGAVVASGMQNSDMNDFYDQVAQNESAAVQQALLGQQQLGVQQQGLGAQLAGTGISGANQRAGTAADLLSSLESGATNRYKVGGDIASGTNQQETQRLLSALGLIPDIQNSATNVMGTVGGLGLKGADLENSRLNIASELMKTLSGNDISKNSVGLTSLANLLKGQNDYALGAGNLERGSNQDLSSILGLLLTNSISGGNLDLNKANGLANALGQGGRNSIDLGSLLTSAFGQNAQNTQNLANPWMQYANNGLNTLSGSGNASGGTNPFTALSGLGQTNNRGGR